MKTLNKHSEEYSLEFFQIADYDFQEADPTLMNEESWLRFLDKLEDSSNYDYNTLNIPIKNEKKQFYQQLNL